MYLGYRIYKHNISYIIMHHYSLTAKQIEQGESPETAEPHRKSLPQFVVMWHTLEELCDLMVGITGHAVVVYTVPC